MSPNDGAASIYTEMRLQARVFYKKRNMTPRLSSANENQPLFLSQKLNQQQNSLFATSTEDSLKLAMIKPLFVQCLI